MKIIWKNKPRKNEQGVALIAAIMAVSVLLAIGLSFAFNMRLEETAAANVMNGLKAKYLAEAGISRAVFSLQEQADSNAYLYANFSTFRQDWAEGTTLSSRTDGLDNDGDTFLDGLDIDGEVGNGDFDVRYTLTITGDPDSPGYEDYTFLRNAISDGDVEGHIIRGIIDEEGKININTAQYDLLRGLPGIDVAKANDIIATRGVASFITRAEVMKIGTGVGKRTFYGEDTNNNHRLDSIEDNGTAGPGDPGDDGDGFLDGGIEDLITVFSPSIPDTDSLGNPITVSPVNVNTASEPVLRAVISGAGVGIAGVGDTYRDRVVRAIIEYRSGKDYLTGANIGDGNANPFDGVDSNLTDGIDPVVAAYFGVSGIDENGDGDDDGDDRYVFAGGARGEFNAFIDYLESNAGGYNSGGTISVTARDNIKDNADPSSGVDYDGDGTADDNCWTTPFCFKSQYFQIISEGTVRDPSGTIIASAKIERIVGPIKDSDDVVD